LTQDLVPHVSYQQARGQWTDPEVHQIVSARASRLPDSPFNYTHIWFQKFRQSGSQGNRA